MTTVLTTSTSADFLSALPALVGFTPRDSLVLVPFEGGRTHGAMRVDLPEDDADPARYAAGAIGLVGRVPHVDACAIVIYTDASAQALELPHAQLVDVLIDDATEYGLRLVDALVVGADGWASYLDGARHALAEIPATSPIPGVGDVSGDQHSGAELPPPDAVAAAAVADELIGVERAVQQGSSFGLRAVDPVVIAAMLGIDDVPAFFERMLEHPVGADPRDLAVLLWCLETPLLRDVALVQWARDAEIGREALTAQLSYLDDGLSTPDHLGEVLIGRGRRPDPVRLGSALALMRTAASLAPGSHRTGALVAVGWLSWALGRSTHAAHAIALARELTPSHSMASLINQVLTAGILPEWAFDGSRSSRPRRIT